MTRDTDNDESLVEAMGRLDEAIRAKREVTRSIALHEEGLYRGKCLDCGHLTPLYTSKYDALGTVEHHECKRVPDTDRKEAR